MNTKIQTESQDQPAKPIRSFYGHGKFKYAVYPDYWKDSWGRKPCLGYVWADDEFYAQREAYSKNLLPMNYTFGPEVVKLNLKPQTTFTTKKQ